MDHKHTAHIYLRVSTDTQDAANQMQGISAYLEKLGAQQTTICEDTASGKTNWRERQIFGILQTAERGDLIIVAEISRLARSTIQVLEILASAAEKGLIVHIVKSNLIMDGSMQSKIIATILGLAAEIEREFIAARTSEALARRKANGLPMGRPKGEAKTLKLDELTDKIEKWHELGIGWASVAKLAGCSRSTLYAWAARRKPQWLAKND
jgi:DNA invertase Pin-like site-specific DNA recombinase